MSEYQYRDFIIKDVPLRNEVIDGRAVVIREYACIVHGRILVRLNLDDLKADIDTTLDELGPPDGPTAD